MLLHDKVVWTLDWRGRGREGGREGEGGRDQERERERGGGG